MKNIRLAIAEDHRLVRQGIVAALKENDQLTVAFDVDNGQLLLDRLQKQRVDIVLLDVDMPVLNGIRTLELLTQHHPDIRVIMLSMHDDHSQISTFFHKGANGYIPKHSDIDKLIDTIYAVHEKGMCIDDEFSSAVLQKILQKNRQSRQLPTQLSAREREIVRLICMEKTTKEIAESLFIDKRTVDGHRARILKKTGVQNTVGLVIYALKNGIIEMGW